MTQKYILTGSPGSGKSTLLLNLEWQGEYIIREAAEDVIKRHQAQGIERPWELPDFQKEILALQLKREERIPKGIQRVWIDRGVPDGLAYLSPGAALHEKLLKHTGEYARVFLIENLGTLEHTRFRRENIATALALEKKFADIYTSLGYALERVAPAPLN